MHYAGKLPCVICPHWEAGSESPPPHFRLKILSPSVLQSLLSGDRIPSPKSVQGEMKMGKQPKNKSSVSLRMARQCYCLLRDIKAPIIGWGHRRHIHQKDSVDPPSASLSSGNSSRLLQLPRFISARRLWAPDLIMFQLGYASYLWFIFQVPYLMISHCRLLCNLLFILLCLLTIYLGSSFKLIQSMAIGPWDQPEQHALLI